MRYVFRCFLLFYATRTESARSPFVVLAVLSRCLVRVFSEQALKIISVGISHRLRNCGNGRIVLREEVLRPLYSEPRDVLVGRNSRYGAKDLSVTADSEKFHSRKALHRQLIAQMGVDKSYRLVKPPHGVFAHRFTEKVKKITELYRGGIPTEPWWKVKSLSGGQLVEQTIHQLDMIRFVFDEPDTVFSMNTSGLIANPPEGYDTDDLTSTVVKFKSGALGVISTGCYVEKAEAFDSKCTFSAADGRMELKLINNVKIFGEAAKKVEEGEGNYVKGDGNVGQGSNEFELYKEENDFAMLSERTFIEAAMSGDTKKVLCDYEDGLRSVAFALACNKSMETGLPVKVDDLLK